jgi:glutathione S-transferase
MTMTLIGTLNSRAARVRWMLQELGLPHDHLPAPPHHADVNAVSPQGKIPVLLVDGAVLTDSTAILQYLADRHGAFTMAPGTLDRARQDGWTHRILDEFDACLWTAARHSFVLPENRRLPAIKESLRWELARNATALAAQMGDGPYLMGADMTVPDIILAHCLIWASAAKMPVEDPRLTDYLARMRARPAFAKAMAA